MGPKMRSMFPVAGRVVEGTWSSRWAWNWQSREVGRQEAGRQRQLKAGGELVRVQKGKAVLHCTGRGAATARLGFSLVGRPGIGWTGREGRGFEGGGREVGLALAKLPSWQPSGHSEGTSDGARTNVMTALSAFPLHVAAAFFSLPPLARGRGHGQTPRTTCLRSLGGAFPSITSFTSPFGTTLRNPPCFWGHEVKSFSTPSTGHTSSLRSSTSPLPNHPQLPGQ